MAVYVEELLPCDRTERWPNDWSCRMFADSLEELKDFAGRLGLRSGWFRRWGLFRYCLIPPSMRVEAIEAGARPVTTAKLAAVANRVNALALPARKRAG